jgi:hypothetical protein
MKTWSIIFQGGIQSLQSLPMKIFFRNSVYLVISWKHMSISIIINQLADIDETAGYKNRNVLHSPRTKAIVSKTNEGTDAAATARVCPFSLINLTC